MSVINVDELDFSDVHILGIHEDGMVVRIEVADPIKDGGTLNINLPLEMFNSRTEDQILYEIWKIVNNRKNSASKSKMEKVYNRLKELKGKSNEDSTQSQTP